MPLTDEGYIPTSFQEFKSGIEAELEVLNPGFDFSPDSPDGQIINIFSLLLATADSNSAMAHNSYDVTVATGAGLENIGHISGVRYQTANRTSADIQLQGIVDTIVPAGSQVSDDLGNIYQTTFNSAVPNSVQVLAVLAGPTPIPANTLTTIVTPVTGWTGITQTVEGVIGGLPETEQQFRNRRTSSVMTPSSSVVDALKAKLIGLGIDQVEILENDTDTVLVDGTPSGYIHITISETILTDLEIGEQIKNYKSMGTPTFGSTRADVVDSKGNIHVIYFTKSVPAEIGIDLDVTFLTSDTAGAEDSIKASLQTYINSLASGEDVIWSRLFGLITPYGKAQINSLLIGIQGGPLTAANVAISDSEYANSQQVNIAITVT